MDDFDFRDAIEQERSHLMTAEALLHCVLIAMDETDGCLDLESPSYSSVLRIARDLVRQCVDQLDWVNLLPMLEGQKSGEAYSEKPESRVRRDEGVRECAPPGYMH